MVLSIYKSNGPINITAIDKVHLKSDRVNGSTLDIVRQPVLYSFALDKPPGYEINKEPRIDLFKKMNKSILSHITWYLEDDDHKPVDFNDETISFSCKLIKIEEINELRYDST